MAWCIALLALAALLANRSEALALSGKQRRFLRAEAARQERDKNLPRAHVASVDASADAVQEMLDAGCEMVRCKFTLAHKKAEAKLLANQLALLVGAEVAEVLGHTALLYRASADNALLESMSRRGDGDA